MSEAAGPSNRRLTSVDRAWRRMDTPRNLMMVNGVMTFDRPLALDAVRALVEDRLLRIDRFRQRVVDEPGAGPPHWVAADPFELDRHLEEFELPAPGGDRELSDLVSRLMSEPLDPNRPLWHFGLVQGYRGTSALIGRIHHCIGDGIALMLVLLSLTDGDASGGGDNPFLSLFQGGSVDFDRVRAETERVMPEGMRLLTRPAEALERLGPVLTGLGSAASLGKLMLRRGDPTTVFKGNLGVEKRAAWSQPIDIAEVHDTRRALGSTVNDTLLTATTGGLRRYIERRGASPSGIDMHAAVPVNLRPLERMATLGNEFGLVFLALPVGIADPVERLAEVGRRMTALKRSVEPVAVLKVLGALGRSPRTVQSSLVQLLAKKVTAVMTNVPGPSRTLYFGGREISDIFFWVPQSGEVGLGVSILSYAGRVRLGIMTDAGLVPDPDVLVAEFEAEWEALRQLAVEKRSEAMG